MNTKNYFEEIGAWPRSARILRAYLIGFVLSLLCICAAYMMVYLHVASGHAWPSHAVIIPTILVLALIQFVVQIICFLHLGYETGSRERLVVLSCAVLIVFILVVGSLWIMFNLNGRMMPGTDQMQQYMDTQQGM